MITFSPYSPSYRVLPAQQSRLNPTNLRFGQEYTPRTVMLPSLDIFDPRHLIERLQSEGIPVHRTGTHVGDGRSRAVKVILYVGDKPSDNAMEKARPFEVRDIGVNRTARRDEQNYSEEFYTAVKAILMAAT